MIAKIMQMTVLLGCLAFNIISGQVQKEGRFKPYGFLKSGRFTDVINEGLILDNSRLLKATIERERPHPLTRARPQAPHKFAEAIDAHINITDTNRGIWVEDPENSRRTWRSVVKSPGALSISLLFDDFMLPEGSELYIIGKDETLGAFTGETNNKPTRKFATTPLAGDSVIIEYHEPLRKDLKNIPAALSIGKIVHGFRSTPFTYGSSQSCEIDVACRKNGQNEGAINSTVVIISDEGTSFCTGTLLNNVRQDGTPYILTANHCIYSDPAYFIVGYNYQQPSCYKSIQEIPPIPPRQQTTHGLSLVSKWETSDYALLRVMERIPEEYNAYLAGWDATLRAPTDVFTVHHPLADVKKITRSTVQPELSTWTPMDRIKIHWRVANWTEGSTERGSSGAALFNKQGLVVGHLRGGSASCFTRDGFDQFGALFASFIYAPEELRIGKYLDPDESGVRLIHGVPLNDVRNRSPSPSGFNHSKTTTTTIRGRDDDSIAAIKNTLHMRHRITRKQPPSYINGYPGI